MTRRIAERIEPGAAKFGGRGDAEQADLRHPVVKLRRKALAFIELGGNGTDFAIGELPRGAADHVVTVEVACDVIHGAMQLMWAARACGARELS